MPSGCMPPLELLNTDPNLQNIEAWHLQTFSDLIGSNQIQSNPIICRDLIGFPITFQNQWFDWKIQSLVGQITNQIIYSEIDVKVGLLKVSIAFLKKKFTLNCFSNATKKNFCVKTMWKQFNGIISYEP